MSEQSLRDVRIEKRQVLEAAGIQVHPDRFERTHTIAETRTLADGTKVRAAGRVGQLRKFGKLTFATLEDFDGHIQLALVRDQLDADPEASKRKYELFSKGVDRWDFLGVEGDMYHTDKGELTIKVHAWTLLGKTLQPPPNKYQGERHRDELAQAIPRSGLESGDARALPRAHEGDHGHPRLPQSQRVRRSGNADPEHP